MTDIEDRIYGCLLGGAIGDAMGAATELRTPSQIRETFGGDVTTFVAAPDDTFARGRPAGSVTDDFSQAYYLARAIVDSGGVLDAETGRAAILAWWADERFRDFAGPTTRIAIDRLTGAQVDEPFYRYRGGQATNGAAMRIAPVGCVALSFDDALDGAITVSLPTHDNHLAATAAGAIAVGVWRALETDGWDGLSRVVDACLEAATRGADRALARTHEVAGPAIAERMHTAVAISELSPDVRHAADLIAARVGCGLAAAEAVPAAVGILAAAPDPMAAIIAAVNAGNDADTVATMTGALAGALAGANAFPAELVDQVQRVNDLDLRELAAQLATVRARRTGSAP